MGCALVEALIKWAKLPINSIEKIELIVMAENKPTIELYRKLGFKDEGRIINEIKMSEDHYIDGILVGLFLTHNP